MKAILKPIKPKTCANILNYSQSILVTKDEREASAIQKLIDKYGYADIYVLCTKDNNNYLYWDWYDPPYVEEEWFVSKVPGIWSEDRKNINGPFNGRVLFVFRCYKIEEMTLPYTKFFTGEYVNSEEERKWQTSTMDEDEILERSCLTESELYKYLVGRNKGAYALHFDYWKIFDEPLELSEFHRIVLVNKLEGYEKPLTKAPSRFCYVEHLNY